MYSQLRQCLYTRHCAKHWEYKDGLYIVCRQIYMRGGVIGNLYELWKFCVHFVEGKEKSHS